MHNRTTHNRVAARSDEPDDPEGAHASNMQACTALMDAHASQSTNKDHFATYIAAQNLLIAQNAQQRTTGSWHGATTPKGAYASRMQARTALHPYSCSHITIHERRSFRNISQIILTERQHHGAVCRVHMHGQCHHAFGTRTQADPPKGSRACILACAKVHAQRAAIRGELHEARRARRVSWLLSTPAIAPGAPPHKTCSSQNAAR